MSFLVDHQRVVARALATEDTVVTTGVVVQEVLELA